MPLCWPCTSWASGGPPAPTWSVAPSLGPAVEMTVQSDGLSTAILGPAVVLELFP